MIWRQRPPGTQFPDSPATDYHGCLDALIVTIREMREVYAEVTAYDGIPAYASRYTQLRMGKSIYEAEERAAICAGMLFDRWIEEAPAECTNCRLSWPGKHEYIHDPKQIF